MPKDVPPPMTAEEMQEKLRSGEVKVVFAESPLIDHYEEQVRKILLAIGKHMGDEEDGGVEWADSAFVSDMSSFDDFSLNDNELLFISQEIGVPVTSQDYIYAVAARMAGAN